LVTLSALMISAPSFVLTAGPFLSRLLKNAHLLRCAANLIARRISIYASLLKFLCALHLSIFEQPAN
jgi:hypothetical protein